ncbi:hypothetical protein HYZ78_01760 [Candidatus Microgenomates bacterium]|nr:hypothetical protein [Candidatus Microgenomates bacterium]
MSERQRYGDGTLRTVYSCNEFHVDEIVLPAGGSTGMRTYARRLHTGVIFKGGLTLYKGWGNGYIVEQYKEGDQFEIDFDQPHRMEAGENGVELIQASIPAVGDNP